MFKDSKESIYKINCFQNLPIAQKYQNKEMIDVEKLSSKKGDIEETLRNIL